MYRLAHNDRRINKLFAKMHKLSPIHELLLEHAIIDDIAIYNGRNGNLYILQDLYNDTIKVQDLSQYNVWKKFANNPDFVMLLCIANPIYVTHFHHILTYDMYKIICYKHPVVLRNLPYELLSTKKFMKVVLRNVLRNISNTHLYFSPEMFNNIDFFLTCHSCYQKAIIRSPCFCVYEYLTDHISEKLYNKMLRYISNDLYFRPHIIHKIVIIVDRNYHTERAIVVSDLKDYPGPNGMGQVFVNSGELPVDTYVKEFSYVHNLSQLVRQNYLNAIIILNMIKDAELQFHLKIKRTFHDVFFSYVKN